MISKSLIERSRSVLNDTSVLGDLTFASGKGITSIGNIVFQAGASLASGSTNGNTLLLRANDTTFITLTTGATDVCTLEGVTLKGTILADGTVTMPALTFGSTTVFTGAATFNGNVVMGTMDIDDDSGAVTLVDMGVTDAPVDGTEESYAFKLDGVSMFTIYGKSDGAGAVDERSLNCNAHLKLLITDTDGIAEGQIWYDASEDKLKFKTASGVETISSS